MSEAAQYTRVAIHPVVALVLIVLSMIILSAPRRNAIVCVLFSLSMIPISQAIEFAGLDFTATRILFLVVLFRVILRKEIRTVKLTRADALVVAFVVLDLAVYSLRVGTMSALTFKVGGAYNTLGYYFVTRLSIASVDDLKYVARRAVQILWLILPFFVMEKVTGINYYSVVGGVERLAYVREGTRRAQGAFSHPILAGTFWTLFLPLILVLFTQARSRISGITGAMLALTIVVLTASSTPLALLGVLLVLSPLKREFVRYRHLVVPTAAIVYALLALVMSSPPYYLISRVAVVGGSTGWHRYNLLYQALNHVSDWIWFGLGESSTESWGTGLWDITNEYIAVAVSGGGGSLMALLAIMVDGFRSVGTLLERGDRSDDPAYWALALMLALHVTAFLVISYFAQLEMMFFFTVGTIASLNEFEAKESFRQPSPNGRESE